MTTTWSVLSPAPRSRLVVVAVCERCSAVFVAAWAARRLGRFAHSGC